MRHLMDVTDASRDDLLRAGLEAFIDEYTIQNIRAMPFDLYRIVEQFEDNGYSVDEALGKPYSIDHDLSDDGWSKMLSKWTLNDFETLLTVLCVGGDDSAFVDSVSEWRDYVIALSVAIYSMRRRGVDVFAPDYEARP